jgi:hypothetical protein
LSDSASSFSKAFLPEKEFKLSAETDAAKNVSFTRAGASLNLWIIMVVFSIGFVVGRLF